MKRNISTVTEEIKFIMKKFPSINSFTHLVRFLRAKAEYLEVPVETLPAIKYIGRVKLHGTNAGVRVNVDASVQPQSRDIFLTPENTNMGFKGFAETIGDGIWNSMAQQILAVNGIQAQTEAVTIFGEWCGQGIQKGTALTQCPKHFVIFGAAHGDVMLPILKEDHTLNTKGLYFISQVPSYSYTVDPHDFQAASDQFNELTASVELECPWAKSMFGVSGVGEGLVWSPVGNAALFDHSDYHFKTKGDKHKARSNPRGDVAPVDVEKVNSIKECVNIILTENRMEQMVNDNRIPLVPESTGQFLKVLAADILKEESAVIEENGLTWKEVGKLVQSIARTWFSERVTQSTMSQ